MRASVVLCDAACCFLVSRGTTWPVVAVSCAVMIGRMPDAKRVVD